MHSIGIKKSRYILIQWTKRKTVHQVGYYTHGIGYLSTAVYIGFVCSTVTHFIIEMLAALFYISNVWVHSVVRVQ
jgi:hypothetical protein